MATMIRRKLGGVKRLLFDGFHAVPNYFGRSAYKLPDLRTYPEFGPRAARAVSGGSSLYYDRLATLYFAAQDAGRRFGALTIAEVGVYKGGTSRFLCESAPSGSTLHAFDTFQGHDAKDIPSGQEGEHTPGAFSDTSYERVKDLLAGHPATLYRGRFQETSAGIAGLAFHLVHLDVDIYEPMRFALEFFRTHLAVGGVLIVDDYGFVTCPGVKQAVEEFVPTAPAFDFSPNLLTGQARLVRLR